MHFGLLFRFRNQSFCSVHIFQGLHIGYDTWAIRRLLNRILCFDTLIIILEEYHDKLQCLSCSDQVNLSSKRYRCIDQQSNQYLYFSKYRYWAQQLDDKEVKNVFLKLKYHKNRGNCNLSIVAECNWSSDITSSILRL